MRHKGARARAHEGRKKKEDGRDEGVWQPRKKDTMQIAMETAAGLPR